MITLSDRNVFFGVHLTAEDKKKLQHEAWKRGVSMSELGAMLIGTGLKLIGYEPSKESK